VVRVERARTSTEQPVSRAISIAAWILAAVALACDIAYVWVIAEEGNFSSGWPVVVFVAAYAVGLAAAAVAGRRASLPRRRSAFLSWAAAGSMATGLAGAFSLVFVPLLLAVTTRSERERLSPVWAALAVVVLIAGLVVGNALETG
jgi:MFS family permease